MNQITGSTEVSYEYTVCVNGQDGQYRRAKSLQAAKSAARKEAHGYGSMASSAQVIKMIEGQRVPVAKLASNGYEWACRGKWDTV